MEINTNAEYYQFSKKISDEIDGTENKIVVELLKNAVTNVFIFDEELNDLKASAKCEVDQRGLVKIDEVYFEGGEKEELVKQVYIITRDIYHFHVFHSGYEDLLLQPVNANYRSEAVHAIMEQYIKKIVLYHKFIKRTLQKIEQSHVRSNKRTGVKKAQEVINSLSNLVKRAKGEMLHGLTLSDLYCEELDEPRGFFKARLSTAMESFDVLAEEIERVNITKILSYLFELTEDSGKLTKLITLLTFIMVILVIFQLWSLLVIK